MLERYDPYKIVVLMSTHQCLGIYIIFKIIHPSTKFKPYKIDILSYISSLLIKRKPSRGSYFFRCALMRIITISLKNSQAHFCNKGELNEDI